MEDLVAVFKDTTNILTNLQLKESIDKYKPAAKKVVSQCVLNDITAPCLGESIQFFNGITTAYSSANIIQAQRDYFGAHTYKRIDDDGVKKHHTNWN
jgi:6-phosphogluconate dehydrogenase